MDDAFFMGGFQPFSNLTAEFQDPMRQFLIYHWEIIEIKMTGLLGSTQLISGYSLLDVKRMSQ